MSQWHRNHPHLVGTSADPSMSSARHRQAAEELRHFGAARVDEDGFRDVEAVTPPPGSKET